ncbi:MAG: xanthine dehydrogenase family protein molybdopterin-binding subunit, partial [Acetobacteraceae bacterium]
MALFEARSQSRLEDRRLLVGEGRYAADGMPPGMLHAVFVRSPHAHARFGAIDFAAARTVPGCVGFYAHQDLDGIAPIPGGIGFKRPDGAPAPKTDRPLLASERVRFVGEPVALVLGETHAAALEAAEKVVVNYAVLPVVTDPEGALQRGAPAVWDEVPDNIGYVWRGGDAERTKAALASAAHVVSLRFPVSRVSANSLEPRGAWAEIEADGRLALHASIQSPFGLRNALAEHIFRTDPSAIRVIAGDVGGSFGMKAGVEVEYALVCWATKKLGRPVQWIADRTEGFLSDEHAREIDVTAELGLDAAGRFTALRVRWNVNLGAYVTGRSGWCVGNFGGVAGVYAIPAIFGECYGIVTNTVPTGPYRGSGRPEATYTIERIVDVAAAELNMGAYELRRRNLIAPEAMPYKTALTFNYDCGEFEANMEAARKLADLDGFPARRAQARQRGKLRGIGICNGIEVAGGPFLKPARDMARLRLDEDGTLVVQSGAMSTGQGLETAFSQLVADRFGVPLAAVRYEQGDTDQLPYGKGNGGSASLCTGGSALWLATDRLIENARRIAAEEMEAAVEDVTLQGGRFVIAGTDRSIDLASVARAAGAAALEGGGNGSPNGGLAELAEFLPEIVNYPNGTHICEVEIDPDTGVTEVLRYSAVEDLGAIVNPLLVDGQMHGGVAQGIGQAMGEKIVHDPETGQLLTASFMDYPMPRADDLPNFRLATREVLTKANPIGAKGVGEAGPVGALAAVVNAVNDALAPFGIRDFDMPATPARV